MAGFHTITLGCKLNRFDSAALEIELLARGLTPDESPDRAAVVIVNTCTVTAKADAEARRIVRRVRRTNPMCRLLVTGCYAERDPRALRFDGVDRVLEHRGGPRWHEVLDDLGLPPRVAGDGPPGACSSPLGLRFGDRARALLKIQEGCDLRCSFCVIPAIRGPSRSVPPEEIESALASLLVDGYREVVLTGTNIGAHGRDLRPRGDLTGLLRRLLGVTGPNRLRLTSLEPLTVTDGILSALADEPRLAPHLHVPLQSGSERILRRMRRNYRGADYLDRLRAARKRVPHAALGADVLVGFPGETDDDFQQTFDLIARSPIDYLHVFAWSPRPGTDASAMPDRCAPATVRRRSAMLRELGGRLSLRFRRRFLGETLDAVLLGPGLSGETCRALTGNYIEVKVDARDVVARHPVRVRIESVSPDEVRGEIVGVPCWADRIAAVPGSPGEPSVPPRSATTEARRG